MPKYSDLLRDPRWQKKRLEIMQRDNFICQICGDGESTLNVHHKYYFHDKKPWEYDNCTLITLCEECHKNEQSWKSETEQNLIESLYNFGFMSNDFHILAIDLHNNKSTLYHPGEQFASALAYILTTREGQDFIFETFFEHLSKTRENK